MPNFVVNVVIHADDFLGQFGMDQFCVFAFHIRVYPRESAVRGFSAKYPYPLARFFKKNSASSISPGVVILILRAEPMTTQTLSPIRSTREASSVPIKPSAAAESKARLMSS